MLSFFKMSCAGNDYLYTFAKKPSKEVIKSVCNRYGGIGSDGVVIIYKKGENFAIKIFNADGSFAPFCGNATLSVAKYLFDSGLVLKNRFVICTDSGDKKVTVFGKKVCKKVRLEVGKPHFQVNKKQFVNKCAINKLFTLFTENGEKVRFRASVVSVGNLHLVVRVGEFNNLKMKKILSAVNKSGLFPNGVNVEFVSFANNRAKVVVFERGSGRTLACASGATAVFWALKNEYKNLKELLINFEGGDIFTKFINGKVSIFGKPKYEKIEKTEWSKW